MKCKKKARTPEEIQEVKQRILDKALELISGDGYNNFSMRKLASKLNMTATPIYGYYKNKDEIYLSVLLQGFENMYQLLSAAYEAGKTPVERLKNICREFIKFGINNPNFYNIMLVLNAPKFYDYVGTSMERLASLELNAAIKVRDFGIKVITESGLIKDQASETSSMIVIELLCSMHGFVSFVNGRIVDYLLQSKENRIDDDVIDQYVELLVLGSKATPDLL